MTGSIEGRSWSSAARAARREVSESESISASRSWWDRHADEYQNDHGDFLGDTSWMWGPEGTTEDQLKLLGPVAGKKVLELGCGAGSGARWVIAHDGVAVGVDLSLRQLQHSRRIDEQLSVNTPVVAADASHLPFAPASFDIVGSAYGALPFVADVGTALAEVARVLRPGGRWAFSVTHPIRWAFPDAPGTSGLTVSRSYFDRASYVEEDESGNATYVEHHRTIADWIALNKEAGFSIDALVEPEWPAQLEAEWGAWSKMRGELIPGTLIVVCTKELMGR